MSSYIVERIEANQIIDFFEIRSQEVC